MAQLNYKLPSNVLEAYGKAVGGTIDPDLAKANRAGVVTKAAVDPIVKGEMDRRAKKATEQEEADKAVKARKKQSDKDLADFKRNASNILEGASAGGVEAQMRFQEQFIDPMLEDYLRFAEGGKEPNAQGRDKIMKRLTILGDRNADMSAGLRKLSENAVGVEPDGTVNESSIDWDAVPPGKSGVSLGQAELAWLTNFKQSSFNLNVGDDDSVFFTMPADQRDDGKDFIITRDMITYINTSGVASGPLQTEIGGIMSRVRTQSAAALKQKDKVGNTSLIFDADTYESEISDLIKQDNIRSFVFGKKVWGNRNAETKVRESWLDNFNAADINVQLEAPDGHSLDRDSDGDVDQADFENYTLTSSDKGLIAELMCAPENFEAAHGILTKYGRMNIDTNIQTAPLDDATDSTNTDHEE